MGEREREGVNLRRLGLARELERVDHLRDRAARLACIRMGGYYLSAWFEDYYYLSFTTILITVIYCLLFQVFWVPGCDLRIYDLQCVV